MKLNWSDTKARTRQQLMHDHAQVIKDIASRPNFDTFRRAVVDKHANTLTKLLRSMRSQSKTIGELTYNLKIICNAV